MLTGTAGGEQISHQATNTSGNTKTQSVYIKADSGVQWIRLIQVRAGFTNSASTHFDIQNGVKGAKEENGTTSVVDDATKIEDAGNGWYRLTLVCTDSTNNINFDTRVRTAIADGSGTRVSNGSYFIWGYQMESDASYPTSYIPNHSGTGSVTRGVDVATGAGDATTFNDSEGVLFVDTSILSDDSDSKRLTISDGTFANRITLSISGNIVSGFINVNNVTQYTFFESGQDVVNPIKIAVKYKANNFAIWINGVEYDASTSGTTFPASTLIQLSFDNASGGNVFVGKTKQVLYFPTALEDADLATLTTI
jgi:hypothetical protein